MGMKAIDADRILRVTAYLQAAWKMTPTLSFTEFLADLTDMANYMTDEELVTRCRLRVNYWHERPKKTGRPGA